MRRFFAAFGVLLSIAAAVLVLRALAIGKPQPAGARRARLAREDDRGALERFAAAIRIPTVSHQDATRDDATALAAFRAHLERSFPRLHAALAREVIAGGSLLYRWQGRDPAALPVVLMAHQDVVPVEAGTEASWTHPPFSGDVDAGFVWGRGTLDVKNKLLATCEAVERLLGAGFVPARTVYLAFGHDEEVGGKGAIAITDRFAARGTRFEWVLDEGGTIAESILPGVTRPLALVGIAEKGYLSLALTAHAEGGHSSMPATTTAIGRLARAIARLEANPMPARMGGTLRQMLASLAPEVGLPLRVLFANADLLRPLLFGGLAQSARGNAVVRTTTAVTLVDGGVKENVLPATARAIVNFRLLPGDASAFVIERVRRVIGDEHVSVVRNEGSPFAEASPESRTDSAAWSLLERVIRDEYPDVAVVPNLVLGATDSRNYRPLCENVYRFSPIRVAPTDLKRVHGTDERVAVDDYLESIAFYERLIRSATGP